MIPPSSLRRALAGFAVPVLGLAAAAACANAQPRAPKVSKDATPAADALTGGGDHAASAGAIAAPLPLKHAPRPTTAAITAADLMTRVYIFADDSMMGREAGTPGNVKGNAYLEGELRRLGLRPAGENGSYLQTVPLVRRGFDQGAALSVDGRALRFGADYLPASTGGAPRSIDGVAVVYGGAMTAEGLQGITAEQAAGKLVVVTAPSAAVLRSMQSLGSLENAAGVALVLLDQLAPQFRTVFARTQTALDSAAFAAAAPGAPPPQATAPLALIVSRAAAEALLGGALGGMTPGHAGKTVRGTVAFRIVRAPAANVVAVLPGSDAALRGSYVALGAHNDHVGMAARPVDHDSLKARNFAERRAYLALDAEGDEDLTPAQQAELRTREAAIAVNVDSLRRLRPARLDSVYNGADDDGSGSMALLEIAENLAGASAKPKRSVLFVWHTAEEKGLIGSKWYTDHPTVPRDSIVAQINIDMIGRGRAEDARNGGSDYVGLVGARRLSTELGDLTDAVNRAQPRPLKFDYALDANGHPQNIYCRSDHYNYARYGIPIVFFFTGLHGDYHQLTDEPQYLDYPHYARITNYVRDLTVRVANLDRRPVVDQPKSDPAGNCQQ